MEVSSGPPVHMTLLCPASVHLCEFSCYMHSSQDVCIDHLPTRQSLSYPLLSPMQVLPIATSTVNIKYQYHTVIILMFTASEVVILQP